MIFMKNKYNLINYMDYSTRTWIILAAVGLLSHTCTSDPPLTKTNEEAVRSLLVVTGSPPSNANYETFKINVSRYGELKPFTFPNPFKQQRKVTVYAAFLYDAVWLYARALHQVLTQGGSYTNGTAVIQQIIGSNYTGIQGFVSQMDENGDAEGNYTLLARQPYRTNVSDYSMRPVGNFQMDRFNRRIPVYRSFVGTEMDWVAGGPPQDEPDCGYRGQHCIPAKTYTLEIIGGVAGGIALVGLIIALVVYRNWRYEQEIAGLLWRIAPDDLKTADSVPGGTERRQSITSRMTMSQLSMDSRMSFTQVYARTGALKGQIVALKMYEKKNLDISRRMQKEMKLMRDLRHTNINAFLGACIDPPFFIIVTDYCPKGSLLDILENEDMKLDNMFIASLVKDIVQGMIFLHDSVLGFHGNLKSSNLVVNSRWSLQITDFGLLEVRAATYKIEEEHAFYRNMFWKAPEHLRLSICTGSVKGDMYSFGIILHEIFGRTGPFGFSDLDPKEIIERVRRKSEPAFRPDVKPLDGDQYVIEVMECCWAEDPDERPDFRSVWKSLQPLRHGMKRNIFDNMVAIMEKYQRNLEDLVEERTTQLMGEKKKTESLLLRMLPNCVADQLKSGQAVVPESYNSVTIFFSDIVGFTNLSAESTPMEVVDMLNDLYTIFDNTIRHFDVYKVETIGDAYMVVSGLPIRNEDHHAGEIASMSLKLLKDITSFRVRHRPDYRMSLRIGVHSGPCVAGVVGLTMPRYTLFGDTVNTASRMETNGEPMKVHCSQSCKCILEKLGGYNLEARGPVPMKGKGDMYTYWLIAEDESFRHARMQRSHKVPSKCQCTPSTPHKYYICKNSPNTCLQPKEPNSDGKSNVPECNIMELLRGPESRVSRSEPGKGFPASPNPATTGGQSVGNSHVTIKSPVNGIVTDTYVRSSSGSDLMSQNTRCVSEREASDRQGEGDTLLVRHVSMGHKPKRRTNAHGSENKRIAISLVPIETQSSGC